MIRRPPRSTRVRSSAASDVYKRQTPNPVRTQEGLAMTVDARLQTLRTAVTELIAFESDLEARLEGEREVVRAYPEALAAIERFGPTVRAQRGRLESYLESIGGAAAGAATDGGLPFYPAAGVSGALRGLCVAFDHGVLSYAMLYE